MPPTERLYYQDSHLIEFEAQVVANSERVSGWTAVTLDRTAFYPTGGGQPSDTGTLNGLRVVECIDDAEGVLHVIQGRALEVGTAVKGRIDWMRRLDHMQQHTGQHILSQAFVKLFNAATRSFRVLDESCEIDVDLKNPTSEIVERAVELANNVIWENRVITIKQVSSQEASELPLRKESGREGDLRLIEIEGFDLTPCGGTHAYQTGEIGMIAVRAWERAKGLARIEFVAGMRALVDYRRANQSARDTAGLFSAGLAETPELAARMIEENKQLRRRVRALEEIAARVEAEELLLHATVTHDNLRIVNQVFDNREAESLKQLALIVISHPATVALFGSRERDAARLVFARSADAARDMNVLMRDACAMLDGRGGGKPDLAQGGGKNTERLEEAMAQALASCAESDAQIAH